MSYEGLGWFCGCLSMYLGWAALCWAGDKVRCAAGVDGCSVRKGCRLAKNQEV